jgi:ribosomal protein S18 acetylase RimI-like enzyme
VKAKISVAFPNKKTQMAVDNRYKNSGIGATLVDYPITLIQDKIAANVGCCFIVTDAKSEAVSFYEKQGFVLLDSEGNQSAEHRLMFLDLVGLA